MAETAYTYIIVGAGLAGTSAVAGIRELDRKGTVAVFGEEKHLPYDRPPLSKKLWLGNLPSEKIFLHGQNFYDDNRVDLKTGVTVQSVDPAAKTVTDLSGTTYRYERLLLATGGRPRKLDVPGGEMPEVCYYRTLDDYKTTRTHARAGNTAVIVGGGFIGSEMAAALNQNKLQVVMVFPDDWLCQKVLPEKTGRALLDYFVGKGVEIIRDKPVTFTRRNGRLATRTDKGRLIESEIIIIGVGIRPDTSLAEAAHLKTADGIVVDEGLCTSDPSIYAAGDNAFFPCRALGKSLRMEHWDNAMQQGLCAGRNMAGASQVYAHLPYFFSDLFEFGYEAVGEVDSRLETFEDWQEQYRKGVIYYLAENKVRGVLLCNIWNKVDVARQMITDGAAARTGAIR